MLLRFQSAASAGASRANNASYVAFLFALFAALAAARIGLNANILNLVISYSTDGGSALVKIHPGSYGLFALLGLAVLTLRIELSAGEVRLAKALLAFMALAIALVVFAGLNGRAGSTGYLVDTHVTAAAAGLLALVFPLAWRRRLGSAILLFLMLSSLVAVAEAATQVRVLPYPMNEIGFRPTGLLEHPLGIGLANATAIGFVAAMPWSAGRKVVASGILLLGVLASGARFGTLVACAAALVIVLRIRPSGMAPERILQLRVLAVLGAALALGALVGGMLALGHLDRFREGLLDDSAMARVRIYQALGAFPWIDLLTGIDLEALRRIAKEEYGLEFIESAFVILIGQFGILGMAAFFWGLARLFRRLAAPAPAAAVVGLLAFLTVALSNNALSSKSPMITLVVLLMLAVARDPQEQDP